MSDERPEFQVVSIFDEEAVLLQRAIQINPNMRQRAEDEEHLASLRELPGWPATTP